MGVINNTPEAILTLFPLGSSMPSYLLWLRTVTLVQAESALELRAKAAKASEVHAYRNQ